MILNHFFLVMGYLVKDKYVLDAKAPLFIAATRHVVKSTHGSVWVVGK